MAITVLNRPYQYDESPLAANNPMIFELDCQFQASSNEYRAGLILEYANALAGPTDTTPVFKEFARVEYTPDENGLVICDISDLVKQLFTDVNFSLHQDFFGVNLSVQKLVRVSFYEAFEYIWPFEDYWYTGDSAIFPLNDEGNETALVRQSAFTYDQFFTPGDFVRVKITNDDGAKPYAEFFDGIYEVKNINYFQVAPYGNGVAITISAPYNLIGSGWAEGEVTYVDRRRVTVPGKTPLMFNVFYSTLGTEEYVQNNISDPFIRGNNLFRYQIVTGGDHTLSNSIQDPVILTYNQDFWMNLSFMNLLNFAEYTVSIKPLVGGSYTSKVFEPIYGHGNLMSMNIGFDAVRQLFNDVMWLDDPDLDGYQLSFNYGLTPPIHQQIVKVYLDKRCKINDIYVAFLDKMGSMGTFAFQLKRYNDIKVSKNGFERYVDPQTKRWNNIGKEFRDTEIERTLTLNTNWMTQEQNRYFEELVATQLAYITFGKTSLDGNTKIWHNVEILTNSIETEYDRNNNLIRKTIKVRPTIRENIMWKNE